MQDVVGRGLEFAFQIGPESGTVLILTARANVVGFWILAVTRTPSVQSGTRAVSLGAAW